MGLGLNCWGKYEEFLKFFFHLFLRFRVAERSDDCVFF